MTSSVRLVVPCFNEAARLDAAAFRAALDAHPDLSLTFVDDGSTDGTRGALLALERARPDRVGVLGLDANVGKGEAVRAGLAAALESRPDFAGWWDADLATPLDEMPRLRAALDANERVWLAMGARVRMLGTRIERRAMRHYAGRVVATLISRALGVATYDTQCGAKLFRVALTPPGLFDEPFLSRWLFDVEVPLSRWTDVPGSKVRATDFLRALLDLRRIRRRYGLRGDRPT